jgi:hypothetical protein
MKWAWKLGRFFGIDVYIHATFVLIILFVAWSHWALGPSRVLDGILFVLAILACVVFHEYGHALTARKYGIKTRDITLYPIGGAAGWHFANWLWTVRGWLDLLVGGVGMRRGRRDPARLQVGDVVDCWRVEAIERERRLRLQAEMKLPGRAWLEFEVQPEADGSRLRQTATFDPLGLWGLTYWYGVWPLHQLVFAGMLRGLARAAEADQ